jgi:hypothetical protein
MEHAMTGNEVLYVIRRADGEPLYGDYSHVIVSDENDWTPAEEDGEEAATVYEMVRMIAEVVDRRTLPLCREHGCADLAAYWGLCEPHARDDDPEYFADYIDNAEQDGEPA